MSVNALLPAFPVHLDIPAASEGLSKRELFAAMAMQGMVTALTRFERNDAGTRAYPEIIEHRPQDVAEISVVYADALLLELAKATQP